MAQYIDKSAVVAEIKRRKELVSDPILSGNDLMIGERNAYFNLLSFLDTLEVKEVDLEKEIKKYIKDNICGYCVPGVEETAKHFFELGLKAQKREEYDSKMY